MSVDMSDVTADDPNERRWIELVRRDAAAMLDDSEKEAVYAAELNAGQTGDERGYADYSADWYRVFADSYDLLRDSRR